MVDESDLRDRLKSLEYQLNATQREVRLEFKELDQRVNTKIIGPVTAALIVGLVGLLGAVVGAYLKGQSDLSVERLKFEAPLIRDALEASSKEKAAENLVFLVRAGLVRDQAGTIIRLTEDPSQLPVRTLEERLRRLEADVIYSTCITQGGQIDFATGECHGGGRPVDLEEDGSLRR